MQTRIGRLENEAGVRLGLLAPLPEAAWTVCGGHDVRRRDGRLRLCDGCLMCLVALVDGPHVLDERAMVALDEFGDRLLAVDHVAVLWQVTRVWPARFAWCAVLGAVAR